MSGDVHVRFCERPGVRLPRATHLVAVFSEEGDARRVMDVLPRRLGKYGLSLHAEKTRLVPFRRPPKGGRKDRDDSASFDFLGFTHHWATSKKGHWVVKQRTSSARVSRTLRRTNEWLRKHRHAPVAWLHARLLRSLRGHYAYFLIAGNSIAVILVKRAIVALWWKWLNRRSQRKGVPWPRMLRLLKRYPLPWPRMARRRTMAVT